MVSKTNQELYDEQMAEVVKVNVIIEGLTEDFNACPATARGYREADQIRGSLLMWKDMRKRMLKYAATVAPEPTADAHVS